MTYIIHTVPPRFREFLVDYLDWAKAGAPVENLHMFDDDFGLCLNYNYWLEAQGIDEGYGQCYLYVESVFSRQGYGRPEYPFDTNRDGSWNEHDILRGNKHRNPKRIAWVKEQIAAL